MTRHVPVMLPAVMRLLDLEPDDAVYDATVGAGGYTKAIAAVLGKGGKIIGTDLDSEAIETVAKSLAGTEVPTCLRAANFRDITAVLEDCKAEALDAAVFDLGFRSEQLDDGRGLSFQSDAPLLMTLKAPVDLEEEDLTARDVVNDWSADSLESIIDGYGDERYAGEIAAAIVEAREKQSLETTMDLVRVIKSAVPHHYRHARRHPATKTFQAIRIAVNDEIGALKEGLAAAFAALAPGGRLVVVSFHSLEDRTVKECFAELEKKGTAENLTDSPVSPDSSELSFNIRARSAKLRAIKKCPTE